MSYYRGFTLLELMIAILIFAMISTAAYRLFDSVTRAHQVTDGLLDSLDELQRVEVVFEKDLFQIVSRSIRNEFGDKEPAIQAPSKSGYLIEFTRSGWKNPLNLVRSNLQRVAYAFEEGELIRYYWPVLDRAPDPIIIRQVLLSDVAGVRIRFMDDKKQWRQSWPPFVESKGEKQGKSEQPVAMPAAIDLAVQHDYYGLIEIVTPLSTFKPGDLESKEKEGQEKKKKGKEERDIELEEDE